MSTRTTRSSGSSSASDNNSRNSTQSTPQSTSTAPSSKPTTFKGPGTTLADNNKPIYFWREHSSPNCYLSQWYSSPFHTGDPNGIVYQTAEQYMMHQKALLFNDYPIARQILQTSSPKEQKALGRKVSNFKDATWNIHRSRIVTDASYYKFKYGTDNGGLVGDGTGFSLKDRLLQTGDRELVESSPMDRIWGIGFVEVDAEANRARWGLNILGKALMAAKDRIRDEETKALKEKGEDAKA